MTAERIVYSVGHSNRTVAELLAILGRYKIEVLVDVRRYPRSRRHPWFNREVLERVLGERGIEYIWMGDSLGGLGRDYRSYMCSEEYRRGIEELAAIAASRVTAFMCAEAYWRRCHRRYIAESLYRRGFRVLHILNLDSVEEHRGLDEELRCV